MDASLIDSIRLVVTEGEVDEFIGVLRCDVELAEKGQEDFMRQALGVLERAGYAGCTFTAQCGGKAALSIAEILHMAYLQPLKRQLATRGLEPFECDRHTAVLRVTPKTRQEVPKAKARRSKPVDFATDTTRMVRMDCPDLKGGASCRLRRAASTNSRKKKRVCRSSQTSSRRR